MASTFGEHGQGRGEPDRDADAGETALRDSEQRLALVLANVREGINMLDLRTGKYVFMSPGQVALTGFTEEEIRGMSAAEAYERCHPDDRHISVEQQRSIAAGKQDLGTVEYRWKVKSGEYRWFSDSRKVVRDTSGQPVALVGVSRDVTDRKRAEEALHEALQALEAHAEVSPLAIVQWGPDYRVSRFSRRAEEMFGWKAEEVLGRRVDEVPWVPAEDWASVRAVMADMSSGARPSNVNANRNLRKDGSVIHCEWYNSCLYGAGGELTSIYSHVLDVTDRVRAQEQLAASEIRFRTLAEAAPVGIFVTDETGENVFVNPAAQGLLDRRGANALGPAWLGAVHPEDLARVSQAWRTATATGGTFRGEFRFVQDSGAVVRVMGFAAPMQDPHGRLMGHVGVVIDVTQQRRVEEQLAAASRLAAMGTLVAGVGHEINNPLAAAMANDGAAVADLAELQQRLSRVDALAQASLAGLVAEIRESVEGALEGDKRIARIVKDLVTLGRSGGGRERVRLRDVVDAAIRWLPPAMSRSAAVDLVERDTPDVLGHAGQLAQVVLNLVTNACKAGREGRPPRVVVRLGPGSPGMARLEVVDDGVGMKPEALCRVFDPFYSTREAGQGMGLGLSICHAIVTEHGGSISAASEPGQGSTFTVELPVAG